MNSRYKLVFVIAILSVPLFLKAQKDSIVLACPFEHGSGREPKQAYYWDPPDRKIVMISQVDTLVLSCITGKVATIELAEDNKTEIVIYMKDYYFWYSGNIKSRVVKGQTISARQAIASYALGTELEFRMFKHEDIMDPRNLLECKIPKGD